MNEIDAQLAASLASRFRLVRRLGQGGMGAVYLAEQIAVGNRPVALKVLSRKLLDDPDFLLRFFVAASSPRHGGVKPPLRRAASTILTSSPFTNPARPMTARPTSPWSFWKANPSVRSSNSGAHFPYPRLRKFSSKRREV